MLHDVVSAAYKGGYRIEITFDDGRHGVVDFSPYLQRGGVFERFRDVTFFREFRVNAELGTLTWADEIDLAPETLYAQATGAPLPDWMAPQEALAQRTFFAQLTRETTVTVPWGQLGVILLLAYGFSRLLTLIPSLQASRIYPAEAPRYEQCPRIERNAQDRLKA